MPETAIATVAPLLYGQVRYANRGFWRTPIAAFFTIVFPLSFLVILSSLYGNAVIDEETGLRLAQFTTPVFAVFGVCMACYVSLALAVSYARGSGVLKRLRGTPLPPAVHIAGRIGSAMWVSMIATVVMVGVGVAFYGVQIIWANVPALVLTFAVGMACFSALGLAVAAIAPTPSAAQAFSNASLILLSFISGIFGFAELPEWMDRIANFFPLKHFVDPVAAGFNPYIDAVDPELERPRRDGGVGDRRRAAGLAPVPVGAGIGTGPYRAPRTARRGARGRRHRRGRAGARPEHVRRGGHQRSPGAQR